MNKTVTAIVVVATLVFLGGGVWFISQSNTAHTSPAKLDAFAKCLSAKKITMYGAYWCPHCQATKKDFGNSFQYVNYVECTVDTQKCSDMNINGYPTWIFPDGTRNEGQMSLRDLSAKSDCPL